MARRWPIRGIAEDISREVRPRALSALAEGTGEWVAGGWRTV